MSFSCFLNKALLWGSNVLLVAFLFAGISQFCESQTDGFSIAKISSSLESRSEWESSPSINETEKEKIFSQTFSYLGFGGQCYAFASEDGQYVIKFFIDQQRFPPKWLLSLPLPSSINAAWQRKIDKKMAKTKRDFTSCKIAHDELKEESALLAIHLNKSNDWKRKIKLKDKLGIVHWVDLDTKEFVLQKKAELFLPHLERLLLTNDRSGLEKSLSSLKDLLISRCQKGIHDEDPSLHRNLGFIGHEAVFIDIGRFKKDPSRKDPVIYAEDLKKIASRLNEKLGNSHPELCSLIEACLRGKDE